MARTTIPHASVSSTINAEGIVLPNGEDSTSSKFTTVLIVVASLLFVAIFAGALVGGIVSGDPTNGFFVTIIVSSAVAISVAVVVSIRYCVKIRAASRQSSSENDRYLSKDGRATFSNSDEDNHEDYYYDEHRRRSKSGVHQGHHRRLRTPHGGRHHGSHTPVGARIREIQAASVAGEVSALSPQTYDVESLSTRKSRGNRQQKRGAAAINSSDRGGGAGGGGALFNFSNVACEAPAREDPPEGAGPATYHAAWLVRGHSQDPSAPKVTADGQFIQDDDEEDGNEDEEDVDLNSFGNSIPSPQSVRSRYDVSDKDDSDVEDIPEDRKDYEATAARTQQTQQEEKKIPSEMEPGTDSETPRESSDESKGESYSRRNRGRRHSDSRSRSRSRSKSPGPPSARQEGRRSKKISKSASTKNRKPQESLILPPPPTSSSARAKSSVPPTPAASEVGSMASSFFKPLAGIFGNKKKTESEAGISETRYYVKDTPEDSGPSGFLMQEESNSRKNAMKSGSDVKSAISTGNSNEGRPPMMPSRSVAVGVDESAKKRHRDLETIGGGLGASVTPKAEERYAPSTPGKNSTFSIPPPRRVPSTPNGSEVFSEFRSMAASSVFSTGVASSTFDPLRHDRALQKMQKIQAKALGAYPISDNMSTYYEEDKESSVAAPSSVMESGGYDVFAPPGALGIVVDTTEKGCIVHSLKKTSPMHGLINPGDLIVALDDFDVRKMTAASLTKLMAKKSQQPERKFTLIPSD